jgi:hypothetical protein
MKICDAARARSGSNRRHFDGDPGSFGKTALIGFYVIKQLAKCNPGQLRPILVSILLRNGRPACSLLTLKNHCRKTGGGYAARPNARRQQMPLFSGYR